MVYSGAAAGLGWMGHRHSEMRGLGTAVQGFVFEKRASVSQRACRTKDIADAQEGGEGSPDGPCRHPLQLRRGWVEG